MRLSPTELHNAVHDGLGAHDAAVVEARTKLIKPKPKPVIPIDQAYVNPKDTAKIEKLKELMSGTEKAQFEAKIKEAEETGSMATYEFPYNPNAVLSSKET